MKSAIQLWLGAITSLALGATAASYAEPASAQAAYGSYVGVGGSVGFGEGTNASGAVAFRYRILELPISFRTQLLVGSGVAIVPTVSYDIPLNWQTEAYIGAGVSFTGGDETPVGDSTAFVLQPGIDYALPSSKLMVFGNAIIAFDGYEDGGSGVSVQGGVGLQF
ncbi:hypothetical protein [Baaleninema sp.]|uniref:hypothetical protein n=1 Tax=Baaleninema sp. TaxID=3101197 RepID=UPI003CFEC41E